MVASPTRGKKKSPHLHIFRDEQEHNEMLTKLNKAKKALCEVCDMMEEIEGGENTMNERGMYRDDMYYRRGGMRHRDGRYGY